MKTLKTTCAAPVSTTKLIRTKQVLPLTGVLEQVRSIKIAKKATFITTVQLKCKRRWVINLLGRGANLGTPITLSRLTGCPSLARPVRLKTCLEFNSKMKKVRNPLTGEASCSSLLFQDKKRFLYNKSWTLFLDLNSTMHLRMIK